MENLYQLCLNKVIDFNLDIDKLSKDIQDDINHLKINKICSNIVSKNKKIEETREFDEFVGYTEGIQEVLQSKRYMTINAIYYEREAKQGIFNCGFMHRGLMLYYIKHELDFFIWYKYKQNTKCSNCSKLDKIGA